MNSLASEEHSTSRLPDPWVERLFSELLAHYGSDFRRKWEGVDVQTMKDVWARKLAGFSGAEIRRGLDALGRFPPNLEEFMELCRPPIDPEAAYYEAIKQLAKREVGGSDTWSHPAIFWAATVVGQYEMRHSSYPTIKTRWLAALREQLNKNEWPAIPKPAIALPAPNEVVPMPDKVREMLSQMRAKYNGDA